MIESARSSLISFSRFIKEDYQVEQFHELIASKLEAVARWDIQYLAISMPPRSGKSKLACINFPARVLGRNPYIKFVITWYGQELVNEFSRETRQIVQSEKYKALFGLQIDTKELSDEEIMERAQKELIKLWVNPHEVQLDTEKITHRRTFRKSDIKENPDRSWYYHAVWVGWWLTWYGFDIGIIDDPVKNREEAESTVYREKIRNRYSSVFNTRQMNQKSATILIMTRWHSDDLRWRLQRINEEMRKKWLDIEYPERHTIDIPALTPNPREEQDGTEKSKRGSFRPNRFDVDYLLRKKYEIGVRDFEALYQQDPIASMGAIFKPQDFKYAKLSDFEDFWWKEPKYRKDHMEMRAFIDPAFSTDKSSDDASIAIMWRHKITNERFLFDLYSDVSAPSVTIDYLFMMLSKRQNRWFNFEWVSCEYVTINNDQVRFYEEIKHQMSLRNEFYPLYKRKPKGKKDDRIKFSLEPIIANHKLFFLEDQIPHDQMAKLLKQLQEFPETDKKDVIDVLSQWQIVWRDRGVKRSDTQKTTSRTFFNPITGESVSVKWSWKHTKF